MSELTKEELEAVAGRIRDAGAPVAGALRATLIAGGRSNLTYRLDDGASAWVMRMPPRSGRTPSAHDVAREFRITSALTGTDVPVPAAVVLCEDEAVIGLPFAVSDFVPGKTIQTRDDLGAFDDETVEAAISAVVAGLAALHQVDHVAVGLERFGRPDRYAERQLRRWSGQWDLVATDDAELLAQAAELRSVLEKSVPEQHVTGIVHGDYRIDNTILDLTQDSPRVAAIVDWELSTIGDPVADVAMMCAYRHPALDLILGSPSAWTSDRLPGPTDLASSYEAVGGVPLREWDFHLALAYFKIAVIAAGIDHRYRAGATSGPGFDTAGDAVGPLLAAGSEHLRA